MCVCVYGGGLDGRGGAEDAKNDVGIQRVCPPWNIILQMKLIKGESGVDVKCRWLNSSS